jgi:hypothetical protein
MTLEMKRNITIGKAIAAMIIEAIIVSLLRVGCGIPTQSSSCVITVETNEGHELTSFAYTRRSRKDHILYCSVRLQDSSTQTPTSYCIVKLVQKQSRISASEQLAGVSTFKEHPALK